MKKSLILLGIISSVLTFSVSCAKIPSKKIKIVMVTNGESINDNGINQDTWNGMINYLKPLKYKENVDFKYIVPDSNSKEDLILAIDNANNWGANAIICPSIKFDQAVYESQKTYPNIKFLIEDGAPHNGNYITDISDNTLSIFFDENELGYLAGYSAVKEGYTNLGFIGGAAVPNVIRFGIGFAAGAYNAANEEKLEINFPCDNYIYLNSFLPCDKAKYSANNIYNNGAELILASCGKADLSIIEIAEKKEKKIITSDYNKTSIDDCILTSTVKNYQKSVEIFLNRVLNNWYSNNEIESLSIKDDAIYLPCDTNSWKFNKFTQKEYNNIITEIKEDKIIVPKNYDELTKYVSSLNYNLELTEKCINSNKK